MIRLTLSASVMLYKLIIKLLFTEDQVERDLPFNVRYKLQRCLDMLQKDAAYYEQERVKLVTQYGTNQEDGTIKVSDENSEKFEHDARELLSKEVSHTFMKLSPEDVLNINVTGVNMDEMNLFMACMVDDPELTDDLNAPIANINNGEAEAATEESTVNK